MAWDRRWIPRGRRGSWSPRCSELKTRWARTCVPEIHTGDLRGDDTRGPPSRGGALSFSLSGEVQKRVCSPWGSAMTPNKNEAPAPSSRCAPVNAGLRSPSCTCGPSGSNCPPSHTSEGSLTKGRARALLRGEKQTFPCHLILLQPQGWPSGGAQARSSYLLTELLKAVLPWRTVARQRETRHQAPAHQAGSRGRGECGFWQEVRGNSFCWTNGPRAPTMLKRDVGSLGLLPGWTHICTPRCPSGVQYVGDWVIS